MKTIPLLLVITISLFLFSCNEKNTIKNESKTDTKETNTGMMKVENGKINPNAQMNCKGSSKIFSVVYKEKPIVFNLVSTEVFWVMNETTQKNELNIWMDNGSTNEEEVYHIKFIISGASSPLEVASYSFNATDKKVVGFLLHNEEVVDTFDKESLGSVTIDGYGNSSNVVCGSFDAKSKKNSVLVGQFNVMLSSF